MSIDPIDSAIESLSDHHIGGPKRSGARAEARKERRIASRIAKSLPEDVRRYFVRKFNGDIEDAFGRLVRGSDHFCEKCGCHRPDSRTVIAGLEMVGAKQPVSQVQVNLFSKLGVRDEVELSALTDSGRRYQSITADATSSLEATAAEAEAFLSEYWQAHPERRSAFLASLGGVSRETAVSGAQQIPDALPAPHTNGDGPA